MRRSANTSGWPIGFVPASPGRFGFADPLVRGGGVSAPAPVAPSTSTASAGPDLPAERYRFRLPPGDALHREIESAVTAGYPNLWLGRYPRKRSDTLWFLR